MIDHVTVRVSDFAKAKEFYSKALSPLGYSVMKEFAEYGVAGLGAGGMADLWLSAKGTEDEGHIAFSAKNKAEVESFYKEALAAGGTDNGKPGYRKEYTPGFYAAFVKDLDGHNIEVVFHDPNPSE